MIVPPLTGVGVYGIFTNLRNSLCVKLVKCHASRESCMEKPFSESIIIKDKILSYLVIASACGTPVWLPWQRSNVATMVEPTKILAS